MEIHLLSQSTVIFVLHFPVCANERLSTKKVSLLYYSRGRYRLSELPTQFSPRRAARVFIFRAHDYSLPGHKFSN